MKTSIVNIIVIGYNLPDMEKECLDSIEKNTKYPHKITFFDNYESGYTLTQIWNKLIRESEEEYICLLNNDTVVHQDWLTKLIGTLQHSPHIGFVGPSTNNANGHYQEKINSYEEACKYPGIGEEVQEPLVGFCLVFRKSLWAKLNGFDERYSLYGQESDFIYRGMQIGYRQIWRHDAFVFHHGEASVKSSGVNIAEERAKGRKLYWSDKKV